MITVSIKLTQFLFFCHYQHKKRQMAVAQVMVEALKYLHFIQKGKCCRTCHSEKLASQRKLSIMNKLKTP